LKRNISMWKIFHIYILRYHHGLRLLYKGYTIMIFNNLKTRRCVEGMEIYMMYRSLYLVIFDRIPKLLINRIND
jgi:hypothetical protein